MNLAHSIAAGQVEIGIAGGVEVMSQADMNNSVDPESISEEVFEVELSSSNCDSFTFSLPSGFSSGSLPLR